MNQPTDSSSEMTPTLLPLDRFPADAAAPNGGRPARARRLAALLLTTCVAGIAACQGAPDPVPAQTEDEALATINQDLSVSTCRQDLRGCLSNAGGLSSLSQCTLDFEGCFAQVALDRVGQGQLLSECRLVADDCLSGAIDRGDIRACGDVLTECAHDVLDEAKGVIRFVGPLVSRVLSVGVRTTRAVVDDVVDLVPAIALQGVRACRDQAGTCIDHAIGNLDIGSCADGLEVCVDGVVDVIDPLLDPLPGVSPSGIANGTAACRSDAKDCIVGALNLNDIRACGDVLGACVDDVTAILDEAVDDVNAIVDPLPVAVPKPSNVVDCSLELTRCLAGLNNPFDCAEQARVCATQ